MQRQLGRMVTAPLICQRARAYNNFGTVRATRSYKCHRMMRFDENLMVDWSKLISVQLALLYSTVPIRNALSEVVVTYSNVNFRSSSTVSPSTALTHNLSRTKSVH